MSLDGFSLKDGFSGSDQFDKLYDEQGNTFKLIQEGVIFACEAKFLCSECKKQFRNQNNLNRHIKLVHDTLGMRMNSYNIENFVDVIIEEKDFTIESKRKRMLYLKKKVK